MSDETAVDLEFGDGLYRFWLPMARIVEIERLCGDKSIVTIWDELASGLGWAAIDEPPVFIGGGPARIKDVYEVIRCAAIGGGLAPVEAKRLVDSYVDGRPLTETVPTAWLILKAAIVGVDLKKKAPEKPQEQPLTSGIRRSAKAKSSPTAAS